MEEFDKNRSPSLSSSSLNDSPKLAGRKTANQPTIRRRFASGGSAQSSSRASSQGCSRAFPDTLSFKETSGDASSSSSAMVEEDDSMPHGRRRVKRRKRRKRLDTDPSSIDPERAKLIEKAVQIEMALLSRKASGYSKLKDVATSDGGLINDDFRRRVWPKLLKIEMIETDVFPSQEEIESHKFYNQVVMDVNRSLKRFPPGIAEEERPALQDQLTRLIVRVLAKHPDLHYYQGYHDVAITFLLVVGEHLGFHIVEALSVGPWLRDFMLPNMEKTNYLLQYIYPILYREQPDFHRFLEISEVGTIFALPWLITWFGHVLPNYVDVVRLYDFFLAQPPLMPIYLAAAIVLYKKDSVMSDDCDMATVHSHLSRIAVDFPIEKLLIVSQKLFKKYPPDSLEADVKERVRRHEAELAERRREAEKKFPILRRTVPKTSSAYTLRWIFPRVLIVATPVVLGVIMFKYFHQVTSDPPILTP